MKLSTLFTDTVYGIGYRFSDSNILDDSTTPFKVIQPEKKRWFADPFCFEKDGEIYVFMEIRYIDKLYAEIGYSKLENGVLTEPKTIIDTKYHMSFPFIFEYNGEIFMMPESCAVNKIQLFRCVDFPEKWEEYSFVKDNRGFYDSVIFEKDGKRFMFTSHATSDLYGSKLYLLEIGGTVENPEIISEKEITNDYRISRQGGKMLEKNGKLIRVAQDCSKSEYGRALEFLEIDDLENYTEHSIRHISPKDIKTEKNIHGIIGVHTYNRVNNFDVVDLKISRFYSKAVFIKTKIFLDMIFKK